MSINVEARASLARRMGSVTPGEKTKLSMICMSLKT